MAINKLRIFQTLHTQVCSYIIVRVNIQQILNSTSLRILRSLRYFIYFQPIALAFLCKEHHRIVHGSRINMFYKVFITGLRTFRTYTTTILCTEFSQRSTFDITHMRNCNNHLIICIEVFRIELF